MSILRSTGAIDCRTSLIIIIYRSTCTMDIEYAQLKTRSEVCFGWTAGQRQG